jgi:hypothetical protein
MVAVDWSATPADDATLDRPPPNWLLLIPNAPRSVPVARSRPYRDAFHHAPRTQDPLLELPRPPPLSLINPSKVTESLSLIQRGSNRARSFNGSAAERSRTVLTRRAEVTQRWRDCGDVCERPRPLASPHSSMRTARAAPLLTLFSIIMGIFIEGRVMDLREMTRYLPHLRSLLTRIEYFGIKGRRNAEKSCKTRAPSAGEPA